MTCRVNTTEYDSILVGAELATANKKIFSNHILHLKNNYKTKKIFVQIIIQDKS